LNPASRRRRRRAFPPAIIYAATKAAACSAGDIGEIFNINGATNSIAGIVSDKGNMPGMMPHPKNHVEDNMGCTDGRCLFAGLVAHFRHAA
jgi:hypothetical protein